MVGVLLLVACSGGRAAAPVDSDTAGGAANGAASESSKGADASSGFVPVASAQPTESGAWVVDPDEPLTLYALGDRSLRSRDGGHTWAELRWPTGAHSLAFAREPARTLLLRATGTLGVGADHLYLSQDEGVSWTDRGTVPSDDLVVVNQENGPVLLAPLNGALIRSTDNGATWSLSSLPLWFGTVPFEVGRIHVSGEASSVVYVDTAATAQTLLVSTDAGATFVAKPLPSSNSVSLDCQGRLYILDGSTVYRSSDAGTTWETLVELDPDVSSFRVLQAAPAACSDVVSAYGDGGGRGAVLLQLVDGAVTRRDLRDSGEVADMGDDRLLLVSTFGNRQRSDDGGLTWWAAGSDLSIGDLVVSPTDAGPLFVSTVAGVYRSDDEGATWRWLPGRYVQDVYPDPNDVNAVYARSIYGDDSPWSFVSKDRGASFQQWPVPNADSPEVPEAIASMASNELAVFTRGGAYVTHDAGEHFSALFTVPAKQQAMWAAISNTDPPAFYAYIGGDDQDADEIVASVDGGVTWSSSDPGTYVTNLVIDPEDTRVVFARPGRSGDTGLLRTLDAGLTWERIAVEDEPYLSVYFDPQPPHALYAVGERLYTSEDHGDTWQTVTDLPANGRDFELDPNPGRARYVLSERGLLYKMTE